MESSSKSGFFVAIIAGLFAYQCSKLNKLEDRVSAAESNADYALATANVSKDAASDANDAAEEAQSTADEAKEKTDTICLNISSACY